MTAPSFFPGLEPVDLPESVKLTAGERRRALHAAKIARGIHPITGLRLRDGDDTCGTCAHRIHVHGGSRAWPKCDLSSMSHGEATDCLARFPACVEWSEK